MSRVAKTTLSLMIVTALAKILGLARELALSSVYGTGLYTEAYLTAMNIPNVIFVAISTAIVTTFIPMYQDITSSQGEQKAIKFLNNFLNIVLLVCLFISTLGIIFSEKLVTIFAIGFEGEKFILTVRFTKILMSGLIFVSTSSILSALLQLKNKFLVYGFGSVPYNIIIIISIYLSSTFGPETLPYGAIIAMIIQLIFYIYFLKETNYIYSNHLNIRDKNLKKLLILLGPVFIGIAVDQFNLIIDNTLASTLAEGSIAALTYANRLSGFAMGIFISSVTSVVYPVLSKLSSQKDKDKFTLSVTSSINIIIAIIIPIAMITIVLSKPIVNIIFERGAFDTKSTLMTSSALVFYALGMLAFGLRDILGKIFYSLHDTKTPMINGIICVLFNIILNIMLKDKMGHTGLAFATSISSTICVVLMFYSLYKKIGYFGQDKIIKATAKSTFASIVMGISIKVTYNIFINFTKKGIVYESFSVLLSVLLGSIIYISMLNTFKIDEVSIIIKLVKKRLKRINK